MEIDITGHEGAPADRDRPARVSPRHSRVIDVTASGLFLNPRHITLLIAATIAFLISASLAGQIAKYQFDLPTLWGLVDLFYIDAEANLSTTFQVFHLMLAAFLLCGIGVHERRSGGRFAHHWFLLAAGFFVLAIDEGSMLHERIPLYRVMQLDGIWASMWVIPGIVGVGCIVFYFRRFVMQMPPPDALQVVAAGGVFVGGAIGVEMAVAGVFDTASPDWEPSYSFALMLHVEELLEMIGVLLFNRFLLYRLAVLPPVSLTVRAS